MSEFKVRIVKLDPMRVASALGFSASPEIDAWNTLLDFARTKKLIDSPQDVRFFGFNNPNPSPGSPNYGYEQWMTVGSEIEASGPVKIVDFPGGLFAVARCHGLDTIGQTWQQLVEWWQDCPYQQADNYCLEELLSPELFINEDGTLANLEEKMHEIIFDLYIPIEE
jgi:DNA gyrase inhibitor GyrI